MNNVENSNIPRYGVLLTDNVDPQWLRDCSPRYFDEYIKFTVDPVNNQIVVGMQVHRNGKALLKAEEKGFAWWQYILR